MRIVTSLIVITAALAMASPAAAQATGTSSSRQRKAVMPKPASPPLPKPKMNIRAFGAFDVEAMSASQTFQAVTGSPVVLGYGGGAEIVNLWSHLFVRGDYTTGSTSGARAFVVDGSVISTGIPLSVRLATTEFAGGWRMPMRKHPKYTPYAGAAFLLVHYSETSDFAADADNVSDSFTGYSVLGGVDIQLKKRWYLSGEAQYRFVPSAIGTAGVSLVYGETDLGGFVGRVMVGFNLRK
jgi:hypothetical protein